MPFSSRRHGSSEERPRGLTLLQPAEKDRNTSCPFTPSYLAPRKRGAQQALHPLFLEADLNFE
jgi:hypothetical protein